MRVSIDELRKKVLKIATRERFVINRKDLLPAAVLIAFTTRDGESNVIFTKRTMTVAKHKGQVSLPGGMAEPEDTDIVATALREAKEEISLEPKLVEVAGLFDDQMTTTGFAVTPVIGFVSPRASFTPDPVEVAEVFEVPISQLTDPANYMLKEGAYRGKTYLDHRYSVGGHVIWGATGRIIHGFFKALDQL